jgi:hypothetical protein
MSKLIDRIVESGMLGNVSFDDMSDLPIIDVTNVTAYMYELSGQDEWAASDFPNVAPPFDEFWMESKAPKTILDNGVIKPWYEIGAGVTSWGFLITALHATHPEYADKFEQFRAQTPDEIRDQVQWLLLITIYIESVKGKPVLSPLAFMVPVGDQGELFTGEDGGIHFGTVPSRTLIETNRYILEEVSASGGELLKSLFMALTFMNCQNVQMADSDYPSKLQKARIRKSKYPLFTFRTLIIEPIKKMLATKGNVGVSGIKMALHICRGHFKRFNDKPLFGKHKGMFWWPQQYRGREVNGVSEHDYKVRPIKTAA